MASRCPICERPQVISDRIPYAPDTIRYECTKCGAFFVNVLFDQIDSLGLTQEKRCLLSGIIRTATDQHGRFGTTIDSDNYEQIIESSGAARSVDEQIEALLLAIAEKSRYIGEATPPEPVEVWVARAYLPTDSHLDSLVEELHERGWLTHGKDAGGVRYRLFLSGWEKVREFRKAHGEGNQAFVAMWFHPDMDPIFDQGIAPALRKTGYRPYRVDKEAHHDRIDNRIVAQIRRSRILIADVTGERGGVYYEAGLAEGLGKPVIWCCNESWQTRLPEAVKPWSTENPRCRTYTWKERIHFDTRQFPHILWTNADDLRTQLIERIEALGLALPNVRETER
jgi:nucleoside 2-deoxyribosyltransferase